jgi:hypothetical protein
LFGAAYVAAVAFVVYGLQSSAGNVLLALAAGANLSRYLGVTVGQAEFLRWTIDATRRLVWLERYAARHDDRADREAPPRLREGIRLQDVSFRYPGTDALVLDNVNLDLPAVRLSPWSAEAPAKTLVSCSASSTHRRRGASASTAPISLVSQPHAGATAWPAPFRTSSASSSAPRPPSASATSRARTSRRP